jgi:hypothetical protein
MTADGKLGVATKRLANPEAPVYALEKVTYLREGNPQVRRAESSVVRRSDQAIVATWVTYARIGGDVPTGMSEGTNFICPDLREMTSDLDRQLFVIDGESK